MVFFVIENKRKIIYNEYKIEEEKRMKKEKQNSLPTRGVNLGGYIRK